MEPVQRTSYRVFIVAGEPSGDVLAARLMAGLKQVAGEAQLTFTGVGGPLMQEQGLKSLFPMDELTIMGLAEVVPQIPNLLKRIKQTARAAIDQRPDVFITVDAPDFSFRVARKLGRTNFPKIHYVAPSVWAWRAGRAKKIAGIYDHLLALLPFEPPYFQKEGLATDFVGHSIVECGADKGDGDQFRSNRKIAANTSLLMMLPGSRRGEVSRHMDVFRETTEQMLSKIPALELVIPVVGKTKPLVFDATQKWKVPVHLVEDSAEKYDAMAAANVALAASGTVGLELALAQLPSVIAYRMHPITSYIARRVINLDYVNLINILEKQQIVPEFLLEDCLSENLVGPLVDLFENSEARKSQIDGYASAMDKLRGNGDAPGVQAAKSTLNLLKQS
jgi:lipid-A-disaccharide synthase